MVLHSVQESTASVKWRGFDTGFYKTRNRVSTWKANGALPFRASDPSENCTFIVIDTLYGSPCLWCRSKATYRSICVKQLLLLDPNTEMTDECVSFTSPVIRHGRKTAKVSSGNTAGNHYDFISVNDPPPSLLPAKKLHCHLRRSGEELCRALLPIAGILRSLHVISLRITYYQNILVRTM